MKSRAIGPRTEEIQVEIDGQTYRGERRVTGEHELQQEVRFEQLRERDVNDYEPSDEAFMRDVARVILRHLIEQWKARAATKPVKVEPTDPSRGQRSGA